MKHTSTGDRTVAARNDYGTGAHLCHPLEHLLDAGHHALQPAEEDVRAVVLCGQHSHMLATDATVGQQEREGYRSS